MASETPSGWYPDPSGEDELRWWDGTNWTSTTRGSLATGAVATAPARTREGPRLGAILALIGLLLLTAGVVIAAIFMTGGDGPSDPVTSPSLTDGAAQEEAATSEGEAEDDGPPSDEADEQPAAEREQPEAPEEPDTDATTTIDFDGVCSVQVDDADLSDDPRPWSFPECTSAPVELADGQERWIVVVASLSDTDFGEADARERVEEGGLPDDVLYSSHYPSLNPGLWVVYAGPFESENEARDAAEEIGAGSYPRVLSDDDADRYCIAADGCVGQRDED